jgi:sugar phosphate permease
MGQTETIPRHRWRIAWLLGLGVLVNYFDRVNLSVSHASLITAFGISDVAFGYLSGAYNWSYGLCQIPIGLVLDKFGVRRVGRVGVALWSIASFGAAVAARRRRIAYLPCKREGGWRVVPAAGAQLCHILL